MRAVRGEYDTRSRGKEGGAIATIGVERRTEHEVEALLRFEVTRCAKSNELAPSHDESLASLCNKRLMRNGRIFIFCRFVLFWEGGKFFKKKARRVQVAET